MAPFEEIEDVKIKLDKFGFDMFPPAQSPKNLFKFFGLHENLAGKKFSID